MISGFGGGTRVNYVHHSEVHSLSHLPVPFNIPDVLYSLLFEDVGIEFDAKQKDMLETLRFSYNALGKLQALHAKKEQKIKEELIHDAQNIKLKEALEDMRLDMLQASHQFKDIVTAMAELLKREQYEKLLEFSNIPR